MRRRIAIIVVLLASVCGCAGGDRVVRTEPGALVDIDRRADDAYRGGDNELAARLYRTLVGSVPDESPYWYRLANTLVRTGDYHDAAAAYRRTLALDPENARAWHNLGIVRLRQAQQSFAQGVEHSRAGNPVFDESLRLSSAVFSLVGAAGKETPDPEPPAIDPLRTHQEPPPVAGDR